MNPVPDIAAATAAADGMLPEVWRVDRVRRETHDTFTLELGPERPGSERAFEPGQFNMLYVFGVGEVPISISGDPRRRDRVVHTTRAVGRVTNVMSGLKTGGRIGLRGPYGTPWPVAAAQGRDVVLVAGGIGLAPLRPALYAILHRRNDFRNVVLLYGTRSPGDILFRQELERWRARFDLDVHVTVDRGAPSWKGNVGVVTTLVQKAPFDPRNAVAFICGPEVMIRFTAAELQRRGVPLDDVHISMERNMKCGIGLCGHCQLAGVFVCRDGPVFPYSRVADLVTQWEV